MPGTPPTTPRLGLPRFDNATDDADFAGAINPIVDNVDNLGQEAWRVVGASGQPAYGTDPVEGLSWSGNVAFAKAGNRVFFKGTAVFPVTAGAVPVMFVLPTGYRPPAGQERYFIVRGLGPSPGTSSPRYVTVDGTTGNVTCPVQEVNISFDQVHFSTV